MPRLTAIVTAAGRSSRMGSLKALAPWGRTTLLRHQIETLRMGAFDRVVVVLGYEADTLAAHIADLPGVTVAINPKWGEGRSTSFEAAAETLADLLPARVLICAVDQPIVPSVLEALLAHPDHEALLAPCFNHRSGHPILLPATSSTALAKATHYPQGLRDIAATARRVLVPVDTPLIHLDLNTPEDLTRATP